MFHWVIVALRWKTHPLPVTVHFELGLHNSMHEQFSGLEVNGCLFHFKQSNRKKMIELKNSSAQISIAMEPNVLDILTIVPKVEL